MGLGWGLRKRLGWGSQKLIDDHKEDKFMGMKVGRGCRGEKVSFLKSCCYRKRSVLWPEAGVEWGMFKRRGESYEDYEKLRKEAQERLAVKAKSQTLMVS